MMTGVAFTVGAVSNVYFYEHTGKIASAAVAGGNVDLIIPLFIDLAMPSWFVVVFMLTLLAAAMSTPRPSSTQWGPRSATASGST